ncbi:hypothetical protein EW093_00550 [Thiospirochaeta perfilievii]|uniref:Uncharacterized protein n=1 Tax=Thiospirochaeta perfilievii TaxID=252967 RepID=A0A5C1Q9D7_9SPIO|nr:hypothetical protein [Thiospirochaeta perfilievii]QEN03254.1 hypothetical protein EW093_00550 [Thiospirochaeta perfilievii]
MKKLVSIFLFILLFSCKSVDNWEEEPVLDQQTVLSARTYLDKESSFLLLKESRNRYNLSDDSTIEEINKRLKIEKEIAIMSQSILNSWFDFYLVLRQDSGYYDAYKGHYYFRHAIDSLAFVNRLKNKIVIETLRDNQFYDRLIELEGVFMLAIGEIVAYNSSDIDIDALYRELKKISKTMD